MRMFSVLLKKDLLNMFSLKKFLQGKKITFVFGAIGVLIGLGAIVFYEYLFLDFSISLGVPTIFFFVIGLIEYMIGIFTSIRLAPGYLYQCKDYDLLFSMPIKSTTIFSEKITQLYLYNLMSTLMFCLPAMVLYGIMVTPAISFYFLAISLFLVLPIIPSIIGSFISLLLTWISSKFRYVKIVNTVLYFLFFILIVFGSGFIGGFASSGSENLQGIASATSGIMNQWFLTPILWFAEGIIGGNLKSVAFLIGTSLLVFVGFVFLFGKVFSSINTLLKETPQKSNYKMKQQKSAGVLGGLLKKEWSFATINNTVILNVFLGPIMIVLFSLVFFFGHDYFIEEMISSIGTSIPGVNSVEIGGMINQFIQENLGIVVAILLLVYFYLMNILATSSFSISIEGKSFWITKSMPVSTSMIFFSKCALQVIIALPVLIISLICVALPLELPVEAIALIFFPVLLDTILASVAGLFGNLLFPKMRWEQPATIVKQSAAAMIAVFSHIIGLAIAAGTYFLLFSQGILITGFGLNDGTGLFVIFLMAAQLLAIILLLFLLNTVGKKRFFEIEA